MKVSRFVGGGRQGRGGAEAGLGSLSYMKRGERLSNWKATGELWEFSSIRGELGHW